LKEEAVGSLLPAHSLQAIGFLTGLNGYSCGLKGFNYINAKIAPARDTRIIAQMFQERKGSIDSLVFFSALSSAWVA
jgi:hypothetical protein